MLLPQEAPAPPNAEIVVVANKMRKVRLEFTMFGPYLKSCDVAQSSGEARIDRMVCAVLKTCINEGYRDVGPAKECIYRKIDSLQDRGPVADMELAGVARPPARGSQVATTPDHPAKVSDSDESGEIIVTAPTLPTAGYWRFRAMRASVSAASARNVPPTSWGRCITRDGAESSLQQMIGNGVTVSASGTCKLANLSVSQGRIVGERRCLSQRSRSHTTIRGIYNADQIRYEERTETVMMNRTEGGPSENERVSVISGTRVGECGEH
jgi:hypothetical protein